MKWAEYVERRGR